MMWTLVLVSVSGGILATIIVARMTSKSHQTPEIAAQPTPLKVEVDVVVRTSSSHALCPCWCPFCDASFEDLDHSKEIAELARRLQTLYESSDEPRHDSLVVNQRHMEFMRYLVQSGRFKEDL